MSFESPKMVAMVERDGVTLLAMKGETTAAADMAGSNRFAVRGPTGGRGEPARSPMGSHGKR